MAIIYTKDLPTDKILFSNVNNVFEFRSDGLIEPAKATITFSGTTQTIYPAPNGRFYYNFKDLVNAKINLDNYKDDLNIDIQNTGYVYNWTSKIYLTSDVTITVIFVNATQITRTINVKFISGQIQLEDFKRRYPVNLIVNKPFILSAFENNTNNKCYLKYWEGYPFDLTLYVGNATTMNVKNLTNLLDYNFSGLNIINRLAFSDGNTDTTIDDVLSLAYGFNDIQIRSNNSNYYLELEKLADPCSGTYIKWINDFGGWNFWLFGKANRNRRTRDLGEIENDFNNLEDTISPLVQIGKASNDLIQFTTGLLNEKENILIQSLFDSPKIYLFTGQPFSKNTFNDWMEVVLSNTDYRVVNERESQTEYVLNFELPTRNTRRI